MSVQRERTVILAQLLLLAGVSWGILIWQSRTMNQVGMGLTMGMGGVVFIILWVVMMIAMMFPTAAPMILAFARVQRDRQHGEHTLAPTWVFISAYLFIWALFGALAYLVASAAEGLAQDMPWLMFNAARFGGGLLVLAGLYQLTPLKRVCLATCRTPVEFINMSWRDGLLGAMRMGLAHGLACLGSSWLLFVILFPLGMLNLAALALVTALILAEKCFPLGARIAQVSAVVLMFYGVLVIVVPAALPLSGASM